MTTTKRSEAEKLARSKVRIKEYTDCFGDRVYKVQTKKWYGWVSKANDYLMISTTFNSYQGARIAAEAEIERLINKKENAKYYYYPF